MHLLPIDNMRFADIAGHQDTIDSLRQSVDSGHIPHAIMLAGISGIGKFRLARALAQYIHCRHRVDGDSCGKCPSCLQHQKHNNPDLHFVYPIVKRDGAAVSTDFIEPWREMLDDWSYMPPEKWNDLMQAGNSQPAIHVTESEDIIARSALSAYQENFKIFLIWQPEKLRPEAANKLLKIIEEPYDDTLFILVSNDDQKVLPTIFSRTQRFNLKPLDREEIEKHLEDNCHVARSVAGESARLAEGSAAKAEILACHPDEIIEFSDLFKEVMRNAYGLKAQMLRTLSERLASMGRERIIRFLGYAARMVRENFMFNMRMPQISLMTREEEEFSYRFAPFIHVGNVEQLTAEISRAANDIERNANAKIVMFDLMLLISQWVRTPKPATLPL